MENPAVPGKSAWKITACVMAGGFLLLLAAIPALSWYNEWDSHRRHAVEIGQVFRERIIPGAEFVRAFVAREHRLPTDDELEKAGWKIGTYNGHDGWMGIIRERPAWADDWGVNGKDFMVESAVSDWNLYYCSWNNRRIEAEWP